MIYFEPQDKVFSTTPSPTADPVKVIRRGDRPAFVDHGKAVIALFTNHPKETVWIPLEDLPF